MSAFVGCLAILGLRYVTLSHQLSVIERERKKKRKRFRHMINLQDLLSIACQERISEKEKRESKKR